MDDIKFIGLDIAKNVFHAVGLNAKGKQVFRKKLSRKQLLSYFGNSKPCFVSMEGCPCPNHYDGHLATMPSDDFCLIINKVTPVDAIGFHRIRSFQSMRLKSLGTYKPEPHWLLTDRLLGRSSQIRA